MLLTLFHQGNERRTCNLTKVKACATSITISVDYAVEGFFSELHSEYFFPPQLGTGIVVVNDAWKNNRFDKIWWIF